MVQSSIEKKVCGDCGAEARPNALFCYNCGGEISVEKKILEIIPELEKPAAAIVDTEEKQSTPTVIEEEQKTAGVSEIVKAEKVPVPADASVQPERKSKSAASMRRKAKSIQKTTVEVVWEEHDNAPNGWFIGVAVFLVIVAGAIIFIAMSLR